MRQRRHSAWEGTRRASMAGAELQMSPVSSKVSHSPRRPAAAGVPGASPRSRRMSTGRPARRPPGGSPPALPSRSVTPSSTTSRRSRRASTATASVRRSSPRSPRTTALRNKPLVWGTGRKGLGVWDVPTPPPPLFDNVVGYVREHGPAGGAVPIVNPDVPSPDTAAATSTSKTHAAEAAYFWNPTSKFTSSARFTFSRSPRQWLIKPNLNTKDVDFTVHDKPFLPVGSRFKNGPKPGFGSQVRMGALPSMLPEEVVLGTR